jgi:hypothetical protein
VAPFARTSREDDYRTAWAFFCRAGRDADYCQQRPARITHAVLTLGAPCHAEESTEE